MAPVEDSSVADVAERSVEGRSVEERSVEERSVEGWARAYVLSTDLGRKCAPPPLPRRWEGCNRSQCITQPGRPSELRVSYERPRSIKLGALRAPEARARLLHKFWHHELQAAELMCWALLRFPETELAFRRGVLKICRDEIRHMSLYRAHIEALGYAIGDFPVRDWFWERVPTCQTPVAFVALLGMGLEAANLEHTPRFAAWFRTVGDEAGAAVQEQVGREEVAHVRFATRWFRRWTETGDFDVWRESLPEPLTPLLLRGKTINRESRLRAGMDEEFIERLEAWRPEA